MQTGNTDFIYRNELDKACFQYDMAYSRSKDLEKRTRSDKVLRDKAFKIPSDPKYDGYQRRLASMVHKFFDKKSSGSGLLINQIISSQMSFISQLLKNFKKTKTYSSFRHNICGIDLAVMQSLSKYNKRIP